MCIRDRFSVHACDVDELLQLIKDQYIEMYSYPNFFEVVERMIITNPDNFNYNQPKLGNLDIREVNKSEYFFA